MLHFNYFTFKTWNWFAMDPSKLRGKQPAWSCRRRVCLDVTSILETTIKHTQKHFTQHIFLPFESRFYSIIISNASWPRDQQNSAQKDNWVSDQRISCQFVGQFSSFFSQLLRGLWLQRIRWKCHFIQPKTQRGAENANSLHWWPDRSGSTTL